MRRTLAGLAVVPLLVVSGAGPVSAATVATHEGETFTGTAAVVLSDSTASGGRYLFQDSTTPQPPTEQRMQGYVTGYSYWDNTPPGSAQISHPQLHTVAAGTGTYADPITVAVGHTLSGGNDILDWPAGTRFYVPFVRRYFIVEDTCGDGPTPQNGPCHTGYPSPAVTWIDVWVGGGGQSREASDNCMNSITDVHLVIRNPASDYRVVAGELTANCATYDETPTT